MVSPVSAATIDPASFGAIADDGADDTAAINQACAAAGPEDIVRLSPGVYIISNSLKPKNFTMLAGAEGGARTVLRDSGTTAHAMIRLDGTEGVEIANLTLDGAENPAVQQGIQASNSQNLNIHDVAIRGLVKSEAFGPHGIYFTRNVTDSVIADCLFTSIGLASEWGAGIRLAYGSSRNRVLGNVIAGTGRGGILAGNDSTTLVVRRNAVSGSGGSGLGIELWGGCGGSLVEDNAIDHWLSIDRSSGSAVRRNAVSDRSGVYKHCGLELVSSQNCVFTSNTVEGGSDIGISISNKDPKENIYWADNTIRGVSTWALQLQGEAGGAAYHYFYRNRFLDTPHGHPLARYPDSGHAFRFNDNARAIVLDGCEIAGNQGAAIQFVGLNLDRLAFRNLNIHDNLKLVTGKPPAALEWENNTVAGLPGATPPPAPGFGSRPRAAFEAPASANAGEPVRFTNTSAAEGGLARVLWDFEQGLPSTEMNPEFVFAEPGTVTVTLIVWGENGAGERAEREIRIVQPAPNSARGEAKRYE